MEVGSREIGLLLRFGLYHYLRRYVTRTLIDARLVKRDGPPSWSLLCSFGNSKVHPRYAGMQTGGVLALSSDCDYCGQRNKAMPQFLCAGYFSCVSTSASSSLRSSQHLGLLVQTYEDRVIGREDRARARISSQVGARTMRTWWRRQKSLPSWT
jgi:hypothetical protein